MKAIILAAGYATRLYPLTLNRPKAMLPIGDHAMLDYLVREMALIPQLDEVHIVTNHKFAAQFEDWCAAVEREKRYPGLRFAVWDDGTTSNDDRLGAVGDMQYTIERACLDDDVLVAASDNFFTFPLRLFTEAFEKSGLDTLLVGKIDDLDTLRRFGVATLDGSGHITSLVEKPQDPPSDIGVYALYLYRRDTLPLVGQYLAGGGLPDSPGLFPEWLCKRGHTLNSYLFEGECIDIGTPESYREVCERFAAAK